MTIYETHPADSRVTNMGETCQTVTSRWGTGGGNVPLVQPISYRKSRRAQSTEDCETWVEDEVTNTINLFDQGDVRATQAIVQPIAWDEDLNARENVMGALIRGGDGGRRDGVAYPITFSSVQSNQGINPDLPVSQTLEAKNPMAVAQPIPIDTMNHIGRGDSHSFGGFEPGAPSYTLTKGHSHAVATQMAVRRLTPVECERLQGFPDNYTNIREKCPDGPRYKALGNSMAVPVMKWIGQRIQAVEEL